MNCTSIYREYRPKKFSDVVGQQHVVRILTNQLKNNAVSHSYLFTGTRGTGKTSVARILARAVNCLHPLADGSPCGECDACKHLEVGSLDIIELDAASNRGIDEIRRIIDMTRIPPAAVKYKVFIIDEVHMLTPEAFNSLLKTLEEPPEYCIFILATTEQHKLLQTIISRCLVLDFRLLTHAQLTGQLQYIFNDLGITYEDAALSMLATLGDGSMRDTLSIAEICRSYCDGHVTLADIIEVLGISDPSHIFRLVQAIMLGEYGNIFTEIDGLNALGKSMSQLYGELNAAFSALLYLKNGYTKALVGYSEQLRSSYSQLAASCSNERISRALDIFVGAETQMRYASSKRVLLESLSVKAADLTAELSPDKLLLRLKELERTVEELKKNGLSARVVPITPTAPSASASLSQAEKEDTTAEKRTISTQAQAKVETGSVSMQASHSAQPTKTPPPWGDSPADIERLLAEKGITKAELDRALGRTPDLLSALQAEEEEDNPFATQAEDNPFATAEVADVPSGQGSPSLTVGLTEPPFMTAGSKPTPQGVASHSEAGVRDNVSPWQEMSKGQDKAAKKGTTLSAMSVMAQMVAYIDNLGDSSHLALSLEAISKLTLENGVLTLTVNDSITYDLLSVSENLGLMKDYLATAYDTPIKLELTCAEKDFKQDIATIEELFECKINIGNRK